MMTLLLRSVTVLTTTTFLISASAFAGLEFTARPKPTDSQNSPLGATSEEPAPVEAPTPHRVQVFGTGEVRPSPPETEAEPVIEEVTEAVTQSVPAPVDAYAEMLKEDAAGTTDIEFQALRSRIRTRQVAEAPSETETTLATPKPAPRPVRKVPASLKPKVAPVRQPMETETITPQGNAKKTNKYVAPAEEVEHLPEAPSNTMQPVNAAFPYTHLLPSPYNLPHGAWVFGSTIGYGVLDSLEVSTNMIRLFQQQWNIEVKVPLVEFPTFMTTAFLDFESVNPHRIAETNPDIRLARWQPGLVTAYELDDNMAFFLGGNFDFGREVEPVHTTAGYYKGARIEADWSWLYNPASSRLGNNALSVGATYDMTYDMFGVGLTHHWRVFDLGVHYTIADRSRFMPIFSFQAASNF